MNFTATTPLGHVTLSLNASCTTLTGAVFDHPIKDAGEKPPLVKEAQMQLDAYFDGSLQNFTLPLSYKMSEAGPLCMLWPPRWKEREPFGREY